MSHVELLDAGVNDDLQKEVMLVDHSAGDAWIRTARKNLTDVER